MELPFYTYGHYAIPEEETKDVPQIFFISALSSKGLAK